MQSGNHAPSFASDLPCPRSDIYSYSESYSYSYSDGVRWHLPAFHLARNSCESVPGVTSCRPPGTEFLQKRSRCLSPPSTWHGIPAKAFQVSLPAVHLARNPRKSVPGGTSCRPPGTEFLQKRSRWHLPASTWHGIPAKAFQVSFPAVHLARKPRKSVPGVTSRLPPGTEFLRKRFRCHFPPSTCHGFPAKVFQVSFPAFHLPRNSRESVPGVFSRRPPGTESPRKRVRCPFLLPTWHGFPTKACQVSFPCRQPATETLSRPE